MGHTSKRSLLLLTILGALGLHGVSAFEERLTTPAADKKPHIVLILVDDWGWANVGYHRAESTPEVFTPNIDSLVKMGVELDQVSGACVRVCVRACVCACVRRVHLSGTVDLCWDTFFSSHVCNMCGKAEHGISMKGYYVI